MKKEERNKLAKSFADEIFKDADMAMQENIDGKNEVRVVASMVLGHILETHDILPKSPESATLVGYVARDKGGPLWFFEPKPERRSVYWTNFVAGYLLPEHHFPSLTFENSPRKARITITPIEDE